MGSTEAESALLIGLLDAVLNIYNQLTLRLMLACACALCTALRAVSINIIILWGQLAPLSLLHFHCLMFSSSLIVQGARNGLLCMLLLGEDRDEQKSTRLNSLYCGMLGNKQVTKWLQYFHTFYSHLLLRNCRNLQRSSRCAENTLEPGQSCVQA